MPGSFDLGKLSPLELLALHARVADALRERGITRTSNNPTGDVAEHLFCKAFGWHQENNSKAHFDAVAKNGDKYQIKGRRVTRRNKSRQLGAIRNLEEKGFSFLAGVLFNENYTVLRAAIIPFAVVQERAKYIAHTNSHKFLLHEDVWKSGGVEDVTDRLRAIHL
jgi:hypothetical protein